MTQPGNETRPVREGEALDWAALDAYLKTVLPHLEGEPDVTQFPGGASNLTYRLRYGNDDLVVRRPPFGTKARSAHSMAREYTVMSALRPVFSSVPEALHLATDESVIDSEFCVMRRVPGTVVKKDFPPSWGFDADDARRFGRAFWDKLVELHQVDIDAAGLGGFGRPEGYATRQVLGWNGRFEKALTPDQDAFEDVRGWLEANLPADAPRASVLHGDYRIDNVIVDSADPCRVLAVLDWEISALGDPLMDLGNALAYWVEADDPAYLQALRMQPSSAPGMPTRREILDVYAERMGLDVGEFTFYRVYGYWRNAVILQQIYYRYYHGQTKDERFAAFGQITGALGGHCRRLIDATP